MTARLDLLAHGASAATSRARFPDDEGLEVSASARSSCGGSCAPMQKCRPRRRARRRESALASTPVEMALSDCDYGRWRSRSKDVAERTGRIRGLARRSRGRPSWRRVARGPDRAHWRLAHAIVGARKRNAGRNPRLGRPRGDCERAWRQFLVLRTDRCRAALACETERS